MVTSSSVAIFTRSMNESLYKMATSLLDPSFPRFRLVNYGATEYLIRCSTFPDTDWVVNIDEDAFLLNNGALIELLNYMAENDFAICGVPDGGVIKHRFHNPLIPNPFFNIFNTRKIRELEKFKTSKPTPQAQFTNEIKRLFPESIKNLYRKAHRLKKDNGKDLRDLTPFHLIKDKYNYKYDFFEEYYDYIFYLFRKGLRALYLDAMEWENDKISTIVKDHFNRPFLIHTWFAREYGISAMETDRIKKAFLYAANNNTR